MQSKLGVDIVTLKLVTQLLICPVFSRIFCLEFIFHIIFFVRTFFSRQVQAVPPRQGRVAVLGPRKREPGDQLHADQSGQPDRHHVRPLLAQRKVHHPTFTRKRSRPRTDEQFLHGTR